MEHTKIFISLIVRNSSVAKYHFDGLVQDCSNSSALAMELLQSSTKPTIYILIELDLKYLSEMVPRFPGIYVKYNVE